MARRDLSWRAAGIGVLIGAAGMIALSGVGMGHVALAAGLPIAGLIGFLVACYGVILLMEGAKARDCWHAAIRNGRAGRATDTGAIPRKLENRPTRDPDRTPAL